MAHIGKIQKEPMPLDSKGADALTFSVLNPIDGSGVGDEKKCFVKPEYCSVESVYLRLQCLCIHQRISICVCK